MTSALEAHLGYWLRFVSNHVSHAFKTKVEAQGVTVAEWVVLRWLFDHASARPSQLAEGVGLTRGAVSKLVDRLVVKRLVTCAADEHDRRAQRVALTAAGRRLVPRLAALADQNDAEAFGHLDADERAALLATLQRMAQHHGLRGAPLE
ncbi:MAG: winged helix-turn-helix transcriptional regulator [Sandaracinaceae bacterium]|nr:winged helix-turn-helix transcriptional regulator [Sandaracinaceae bacterium]